MCRIYSLNFLVLAFVVLSSTSSSTIYPFIPSPRLQAPIPTVVLPPVTYARTPVIYPIVSRRQTEFPIDISQETEPTCDELKKMWRKMRRIARQMEITNQVPTVQNPFISSAYNYKSKYPDPNPYSHAKSSNIKVFQGANNRNFAYPKAVPSSPKSFGAIIRDPVEHKLYKVQNKLSGSSNSGRPKTAVHLGFDEFDDEYPKSGIRRNPERAMGRFSNNPLPEEALGVYGTVVNTPEERAKYRSRSRNRPESSFRSRLGGLNRGPIGRVPFLANERHNTHHYGTPVTHMPADRAGALVGNVPAFRNPNVGEYGEYPTEIGQRLSNAATRVERIDKANAGRLRNSCQRMHNKVCKNDVDCFCVGSPKLFCGGNRCRPRFKIQKYNQTPKWGRSLYSDPYDMMEYEYKQDPLWPAPF